MTVQLAEYFIEILETLEQLYTVEEFYMRVCNLRDLILENDPTYLENYFVACFIQGLNPVIAYYVRNCVPHTFNLAYETALHKELELTKARQFYDVSTLEETAEAIVSKEIFINTDHYFEEPRFDNIAAFTGADSSHIMPISGGLLHVPLDNAAMGITDSISNDISLKEYLQTSRHVNAVEDLVECGTNIEVIWSSSFDKVDEHSCFADNGSGALTNILDKGGTIMSRLQQRVHCISRGTDVIIKVLALSISALTEANWSLLKYVVTRYVLQLGLRDGATNIIDVVSWGLDSIVAPEGINKAYISRHPVQDTYFVGHKASISNYISVSCFTELILESGFIAWHITWSSTSLYLVVVFSSQHLVSVKWSVEETNDLYVVKLSRLVLVLQLLARAWTWQYFPFVGFLCEVLVVQCIILSTVYQFTKHQFKGSFCLESSPVHQALIVSAFSVSHHLSLLGVHMLCPGVLIISLKNNFYGYYGSGNDTCKSTTEIYCSFTEYLCYNAIPLPVYMYLQGALYRVQGSICFILITQPSSIVVKGPPAGPISEAMLGATSCHSSFCREPTGLLNDTLVIDASSLESSGRPPPGNGYILGGAVNLHQNVVSAMFYVCNMEVDYEEQIDIQEDPLAFHDASTTTAPVFDMQVFDDILALLYSDEAYYSGLHMKHFL